MPAKNPVHVDAALSNLIVEEGIGDRFAYEIVFPEFPVQKKSDEFFKLMREEIRQDIPTKRSPHDEALQWTWEVELDAYTCHLHKLKSPIYEDELQNADPGINPDEITAFKTKHKIRVDLEKEAREILTDLSYPGTTITNKWDDYTTTPNVFGDILAGRKAFRQQFGRNPNLIFFEPTVASTLLNTREFIDRLKYIKDNLISDNEMPSRLLGMKTFIPQTISNSANPVSTASIDDVWNTDSVFLLYVNPAQHPAFGEASFGYNIVWQKFGAKGWKVKRWTKPDPEVEFIMVGHYHEFKITASHGLYVLRDTLT